MLLDAITVKLDRSIEDLRSGSLQVSTLAAIRDEQEISDDTETRLMAALDSYAKTFLAA